MWKEGNILVGEPVRVALYVRVSTVEQATEGYSLSAQLNRLRTYCEAKDYEIAGEYIEEGYTGRNINRPEYRRMMAEKDIWDMVLVLKMDRIHRNSRNFMVMMDNFRDWNKSFSSMYENLDTSTAIGRFVIDIIQRIAQLESEQIGERVYEGMREKALSGELNGFPVPYGYYYRKSKLVINAHESKIVKFIFGRYLDVESTTLVTRELNKLGCRPRKSCNWSPRTVCKILNNPVYCSYIRWDGIVHRGKHKPIISIDIFNGVQRLICDNILNPKLKHDPLIIGDKTPRLT